MPYTTSHPPVPSRDELKARIPGWGADLDPADRPSYPKEQLDTDRAPWTYPDEQVERGTREKSIEHPQLTPVFGTTLPLKGLSGAVRRLAYARYGEARAAHWLLLLAADRVDVMEDRVQSMVKLRPIPVLPTGLEPELAHGRSSRFGRGRADVHHQWLDPIVSTIGTAGVALATASVLRRLRRRS